MKIVHLQFSCVWERSMVLRVVFYEQEFGKFFSVEVALHTRNSAFLKIIIVFK